MTFSNPQGEDEVIPPDEPDVGHTIRSIREEKGLSLRDLAELCGLSANAISKIERGESSPTVSSLHRLSTSLGVQITDFFKRDTYQNVIFLGKRNRMRVQNDGMVIEGLGGGLVQQQLEPFLMTIEPGTSNQADPAMHSGEEFVHCLEGKIDYFVGDQKFELHPGDSLLFKATEPHSWDNKGRTPAKLILVFQTDQTRPVPHRL